MNNSESLNVIIVADDPLVRKGLTSLLEPLGLVILDSGPVTELDDFLKEADVLLWDADPELDAHLISQQTLPVLALMNESANAQLLLNAGCLGIVFRSATASRIAIGLHAVAEGLNVLEPTILPSLVFVSSDPDLPLDELTPREFEVLELISEGLSNKAIAKQLSISVNTVKFHVNALLSKFAVKSRTELVVRTLQQGITHL